MSASDYAVNFPYGATTDPYSKIRPHRGNDRPCPAGTPIVIGGTTIGLTGATGMVSGPHLHIQEHTAGNYANTRKPQNEFKPGTVIGVYPNSLGDGTFGKFIDIQTDDGWVDSYCHLSQINVQVGQKVGAMSDSSISESEIDVLRIGHSEIGGWDLNEVHAGKYDKLFVDTYRGQSVSSFIRRQWADGAKWRDRRVAALNYYAQKPTNDAALKAATDKVAELGKAIDIKQKEIDSLKAQVGDNSKWETLKALVRELVGKG